MANKITLSITPCKEGLKFHYKENSDGTNHSFRTLHKISGLAAKILNCLADWCPNFIDRFFAKIVMDHAEGKQMIYWIRRSQIASTFEWNCSNTSCANFQELRAVALTYFKNHSPFRSFRQTSDQTTAPVQAQWQRTKTPNDKVDFINRETNARPREERPKEDIAMLERQRDKLSMDDPQRIVINNLIRKLRNRNEAAYDNQTVAPIEKPSFQESAQELRKGITDLREDLAAVKQTYHNSMSQSKKRMEAHIAKLEKLRDALPKDDEEWIQLDKAIQSLRENHEKTYAALKGIAHANGIIV
jgi:uncharacterized protein YukE